MIGKGLDPGIVRLFRSTNSIQDIDLFVEYVDVLVFGDTEGFEQIVAWLSRASERPTVRGRRFGAGGHPRLCFLPAARRPENQAVLRVYERPVRVRGKPGMELIVYGTRRAYARLASCFRAALQHLDDPDYHVHVDGHFDRWVYGDVSLNIRGPVRKWCGRSLGVWWDVLKQPAKLPESVDWKAVSHSYTPVRLRGNPKGPIAGQW